MGFPVAVFYCIEAEDFFLSVPTTLRSLLLNEQSFKADVNFPVYNLIKLLLNKL